MNKLSGSLKSISQIKIFSFTIIFSFILWLILLLNGDKCQTDTLLCLVNSKDSVFADFFFPTIHSSNLLPYEYLNDETRMWICYPPLVYAVFNFFDILAKSIFFEGAVKVKMFLASAFTGFFLFSVFLLIFNKLNIKSNIEKYLFCVALFVSGPFLFSMERANIVLYSVLFSSFFIFYYDSKNKFLKEIAVFLLACASVFKIMPAILAMLLIYKKDYKAIFRFSAYFILLFILPSLIYPTGLFSLLQFKDNLALFMIEKSHDLRVGTGKGFWVGLICYYFPMLHFNTINIILSLIYFVIGGLGIVFSFFYKSFWRKILLFTLLIIVSTSVSMHYILLYFIPVLILFFSEKEQAECRNIYLIGFIVIFLTVQIHVLEESLNLTFCNFFITLFFIEQFIYGLKQFKKNKGINVISNYFEKKKNLYIYVKNNSRQKTAVICFFKKYFYATILSCLILIAGTFICYKNVDVFSFEVNNLNNKVCLNEKPINLRRHFIVDAKGIFITPKSSNYDNLFQTADYNDGLRMELSPDMVLSLINPTSSKKSSTIFVTKVSAENLYKMHTRITNRSVSSVLYDYPDNMQHTVFKSNELRKIYTKNLVNKIIIGSGFGNTRPFSGKILSFELKIINILNKTVFNCTVILTLIGIFIPFACAFYSRNIRKFFCNKQ